ncbi:putative transcription factor interactor and regulator CCHC(Zn) family [Helianthus anomalus]
MQNPARRKRRIEDSPKTNHFNDRKLRNDQYYKLNQCYDLNVWINEGEWYDNRVCYNCGFQGHIALDCQKKNFEMRRCFECNIKGHIARDCPMRSNGRSMAVS